MSSNLSIVDSQVIDKLELRRSQQLEFLLTVLSSINESNDNSDIIYQLFQQNLDLLGLDIIDVFRNWANDTFAEIDRADQKLIASGLVNFGNLIQQFPLGNKAENLELSIACYRAALGVYVQTNFPLDRAMTQNNLANAYSKRIRGDWVENLERSIKSYRAALKVITQMDLPIDWATTQNNLATIYSYRIKGDKAENLKRSIECYESALQIYTQTDFPIDWAMTQNNLAIVYRSAENLKLSIECYRAALKVYTPEAFPWEWAKIQVALAQFSIEKLQNYQVATEHLQSAYEHLLTNNNNTGLLAQTMFELARCFHQTGCLEQAKIYFKDSIRLYQRLEQPTQVAAATSALGNLELQMGLIDDARLHLQTALEFYQAAGSLERVESIQELQQYLPVTSGASGS